jgi:hypothetical protein
MYCSIIRPTVTYGCETWGLKLYCSIIRPTVTYGCETWVLKETIKNKLMVFEREVLRRIFWSYKRKRWYMENQNKR